jgi:ribonucleoside-diphosphate reductase alpha chain
MASLQQEAEQQFDFVPEVKSNGNGQNGNGHSSEASTEGEGGNPLALGKLSVTGNLCPECGCNTMVYEEGCKKCYSCGYSEC